MTVRLDDVRRLPADAWDEALAASGQRFRFSHRAEAGLELERAYPSYEALRLEASWSDGSRWLLPLVRVRRRLRVLDRLEGMPLGWEGTPLDVGTPMGGGAGAALDTGVEDGESTGEAAGPGQDRLRPLLRSLGGGSIRVNGGPWGTPPGAGREAVGHASVLDLTPGWDRIWSAAFSGKNRTSCRKAEKGGVVARPDADGEHVADYWRLYSDAATGWGYETPPYPRALVEGLARSPHAELWMAFVGERPAAGALLLAGSHDLFYWSGAMDRELGGLYPANAVLRHAIEAACARGYETFDFGASAGLDGVRRFKESFGAEPRPVFAAQAERGAHRILAPLVAALRGGGEA